MSVKIFMPTECFYAKENCDIFGEIQISENNAISYFIIEAVTGSDGDQYFQRRHLRHLGQIVHAAASSEHRHRDVSLSFAYDIDTPNIYLIAMSIKPPHATQINIFLYDKQKVRRLHGIDRLRPIRQSHVEHTEDGDQAKTSSTTEEYDDIEMIFNLLLDRRLPEKAAQSSKLRRGTLICNVLHSILELLTSCFAWIMDWQPVLALLRLTVLYEHYHEWKMFRGTRKRKVNLVLDKVFGICLMLLLLLLIPHPGDYLIQTSHSIISHLRLLLRALKGSPIGLKLNVHLNNFLLDCFNYHIDLWAVFLDLIEPVVRHLFVPIALLGTLGLSYQLAILADLISVVFLHAHCFYIYTAGLYRLELKGLQVLWKVVLGKRFNVLKNRMESHNYINRQLYLATIFFTTLLFLFPTILVYYVVFTTLRLCLYIVRLILQFIRRRVLEFPLQTLCQWAAGRFFEKECLQLHHIRHEPSPLLPPPCAQMRMSVFSINVHLSSLGRVLSCKSGVLQELTAHEQEALEGIGIFKRILKGRF